MGWNWYGWIFLISLILGGLFALSAFIKSKSESAGKLIEQLAPYQGYVGMGLIVISAYNLFLTVRVFKEMMALRPVTSAVFMAALIIGIILGLLDSLDILESRNVVDPNGALVKNLRLIEIPVGILAILVALYLIPSSFFPF